MKTLQKYANMAFLLISVTMIVPAHANPTINEQEQTEQIKQEETIVELQKTETIWYKRPAVIGGVITVATLATLFTAWYTNRLIVPEKLSGWLKYMGTILVGATQPIKKQPIEQPTNCLKDVIVFGKIIQTNGKDTTIITPGRNPISVKQDNVGTWIKQNNQGPWTLI